MKNWEKWESKIREIGIDNMAVIKDTDEVSTCRLDCLVCKFSKHYNFGIGCDTNKTNWLYEEVPKTDWSKVKVDAKVIVKGIGNRHFSHYDEGHDVVYTFADGKTSWSDNGTLMDWDSSECELVEE